jgi:ribose transport system substrate-binding protein
MRHIRTRGLVAVLVVAIAASSAAWTAGAGARTSRPAATINLIWVQPLRNHPVHRIMQAGFLSECKKLKAHCEIVGNPSATVFDVPGSISLAQAALSRTKFNGAAVYAVDPSIYPFIKQLHDKDYPVVSWHTLNLKKGSVPGLDAVTGTNPAIYAKEAASAIGKKIGGKGAVAITQGSFNTTENLVSKVFTQTMHSKFPKVKVLAPQIEGFEPSAARAKAVSILQAHPDLVAAMSTTGGGPATWAGAEDETGKKLVVIGMDYVRQNLDLVKKGKVYAIVAQPLFQEGARTADLLVRLADKKPVSYSNYIPAPVVTKSNLVPYYAFLKKAGQ